MKLLILSLIATSSLASAQTYVQGYTKSNGTYVQGHYRSNADSTTLNNYSTQGNTNPYTGSQGTVNPYNSNNLNQPSSNRELQQRRNAWGN